jgi:hypothetical protein
MRNQACEISAGRSDLSDLFDLNGEGRAGSAYLRDFELREGELFWWRMPRTSRVSRAMQGGSVRRLNPSPLSDPLELFRIIGSHALASRALVYPLRAPAYWVRRRDPEGFEQYFRPALPEVQLSDLLAVPTRQIRPALQPLIEDGAVELVRSPSGVRAVLMRDGFVDEGRLKTRLRA